MGISKFATHNIKAILFVTVVLCALGAWIVTSFPVSILPDITFPRVEIVVHAGDRPVNMMEVGVCRPMEQTIATIPGVTRIRSRNMRGATKISVDFDWGTDMIMAEQLINTKVNELRSSLPPDAEVSVERMNPTVFPIYGFSLECKGLTQSQLWDLATYTLKPLLVRVPGVAQVVVQGDKIPELAVNVHPLRLAAFNLSLQDVENAIAQSNVIKSVGRIDAHFQQYQAIVTGQITNPDQLNNIVVATHNGIPITLKDVASVYPSDKPQQTIVTANGRESVLLNIVRQPNANTVTVVQGVKAELAKAMIMLPAGTHTKVFYDQSILVEDAVKSVRDAVLIGAGLAMIILMMFLGDLRATLVTSAIIPVTLLITFLLMRVAGLTMNLMTLGALAVGIGLVIDDAIVVVENVFRHLSLGESRKNCIEKASAEMTGPMIASSLTSVVVFMPLVLLTGVAGAFFTALAITLTLALITSLILAIIVSPSLSSVFLRVRKNHQEHGKLMEEAIRFYEKVIRGALKRLWIFPLSAAIILACIFFFASRLKTGFMPSMDEGSFVLDYITPPGTSLQESNRILMKIEDILRNTPEVKSFSRRTGTELGFSITEPNTGDFAVMLKPPPRRNIDDVMNGIRDQIQRQVPGVQVDFIEVMQDLIGDLSGAPAPVEIKLFGDHLNQLNSTARKIGDKLEKIPGVVDMNDGVVEMGPQMVMDIDPIKAGRVGMTVDDVATQVNAAMYGDVVTSYLDGYKQIGVRVRYPYQYREDRAQMEMIPIRTPNGIILPLSAFGTIKRSLGSTEIYHENQRRTVSVTAHLANRDLGSVMKDVKTMMQKMTMPPSVSYVLAGQYESQKESFSNLMMVLILAVMLVFSVMLFKFGNFTSPLSIVLVMPLSLFGVTLGLWITGTAWNVSSYMGAIMLVGIVAENGILLFDQAQKNERSGMKLEEAVVHAGRVRLRPILMTSMAMILALFPLAMGWGAGAEMQKPLAIAVIGGMCFSTLFTLIYAPMIYVALRRFEIFELLQHKLHRQEKLKPVPSDAD